LLTKLDERAGSQRGKPRSSDPTRNPLGGLVFDMACGWPLYRQPYQGSFRYLCGLYQQSHGAQCTHNHIDGMLATRFVLGCVRQRLLAPALRSRLEQKLRALAVRECSPGPSEAALSSRRAALASLRGKRERAGENLALAEGPEQYRAVAAVFEQLRHQEQALALEVHRLEQLLANKSDTDAEVAAALAVLDRLGEQASLSPDLGSIGQLFHQLPARLFLRFVEVRKKKRTVNQVAGGVLTFGDTAPPVVLYEGPTGRRHVQGPATPVGIAGPNSPKLPPLPGASPGGEDNSLGNVHRGDWIRTSDLLNPIQAGFADPLSRPTCMVAGW
jgi:hypothetical protein